MGVTPAVGEVAVGDDLLSGASLALAVPQCQCAGHVDAMRIQTTLARSTGAKAAVLSARSRALSFGKREKTWSVAAD